jgi:hypothetical protein
MTICAVCEDFKEQIADAHVAVWNAEPDGGSSHREAKAKYIRLLSQLHAHQDKCGSTRSSNQHLDAPEEENPEIG